MPRMPNVSSTAASAAAAAAGLASRVASHGLVGFVAIALTVLVLVVAYLAFRAWRGADKSAEIIKAPVKLNTAPHVDASAAPATDNGQELAYSFWLYIHDYEPTGDYKLIFQRKDVDGDVSHVNPLVFMHKGTNRLYVALRTNQVKSVPGCGVKGSPACNVNDVMRTVAETGGAGWLVAFVDYVPLQRWVHICFVLHDGMLTLYTDGDLYTLTSVNDVALGNAANLRAVVQGSKGDVSVGSKTTTVNAHICRLRFFAYALTSRDVHSVYHAGPGSSSVLARIGLPSYGIRTPIYKISNA